MLIAYIVCKNATGSLRKKIVGSPKLAEYGLKVNRKQKPGRKPGWAELKSTEYARGAIKLEWDNDTNVLVCRVVTRGAGNPSTVFADFMRYLLDKFRTKIASINTVLR